MLHFLEEFDVFVSSGSACAKGKPSHVLSAMGLSKYANYSVVFGSALHVFNLLVLYFTDNMNMVTLGALVSIAEIAILLFRIIVIWKNRALLHVEQED